MILLLHLSKRYSLQAKRKEFEFTSEHERMYKTSTISKDATKHLTQNKNLNESQYNKCLADIIIKILMENRCRPVEFRYKSYSKCLIISSIYLSGMSVSEAENAQQITSSEGTVYNVVNPTNHKTSRQG